MVVKKIDLGDLVKIKTGRLDANAAVIDGIFPFFTCAREVSRINTYAFEGECVLVAGNGDLNVKYYNGKFNAYQRTYVIEPIDKTSLSPKYLYYFLQSYIEELRGKTIGGVIQYIKLENLKEPKIPLPSLSTQKAIAEKLDKADALRKKDKELLAQYDELAQAIFIDMFGDPVKNEKGWEMSLLDTNLDFLTSGSRGWATYYRTMGDVFLRIQNVGYNELKMNDLTYVKAPKNAEAQRTLVREGDIVLSITADLGRTAVIPRGFPTAHINQHLAILRVNKKAVNPIFLSAFFASTGGQTTFNTLNKGGVKAGLNFTDIKSVKHFIPPIDLQNQFAEKIQNIEAQKGIVKQQAKQSEDLFQALLQESFNFN